MRGVFKTVVKSSQQAFTHCEFYACDWQVEHYPGTLDEWLYLSYKKFPRYVAEHPRPVWRLVRCWSIQQQLVSQVPKVFKMLPRNRTLWKVRSVKDVAESKTRQKLSPFTAFLWGPAHALSGGLPDKGSSSSRGSFTQANPRQLRGRKQNPCYVKLNSEVEM